MGPAGEHKEAGEPMQAELELLEHLEGCGWWLRFRSRSTPAFQATKEQLKTLIAYPDRLWVPEAYGGRGAWFIEEQALARIGHLFSNYSLLRWWAEEGERLRAQTAQAEAERQRREAEQRQRQQQAAPCGLLRPISRRLRCWACPCPRRGGAFSGPIASSRFSITPIMAAATR